MLWWVELSLFPLMHQAVSGRVFCGVCGLSVTLGSLCAKGWGCVPILMFFFGVRCPGLEPAGSWVEPGISVEMDNSRGVHAD